MSLTPIPQAPLTHDKSDSGCGPVAHSKRSRWRAASLIGVHLLVAAHIAHWMVTGSTLTPMEPSEAMMTLEQGAVNAGFLLFVLLILSTLIFGRFFCGWACHVVAYQDLCGWMLKKMGMRPKPFRSRLLVFVPLFAALYMFVWPQVIRVWEGRPMPTFAYHLSTDDFWATFPGPGITILTFAVCGFGIVWVLGNKGFCTYGCPYGALFYHADQVAPGKIRVTDACDGCGHCTATCTSNVIVHEEVATYGMVVDPGCMKCMDCVDVCPKGALYYGFGKPSLAKGKAKKQRAKRVYDYTLPEELGLAAAFLVCLYAFRSLYDGVPFLLTLGLGAICALVLLTAARMLYSPNVRLQRLQLRTASRTSVVGRGFLAGSLLLVALLGHSSAVQYTTRQGTAGHARAIALFDSGETESGRVAAAASLSNLDWAATNGLVPVARVEAMIGNLHLRLGKPGLAITHLQKAAAMQPKSTEIRRAFARNLVELGRVEEAVATLEKAAQADPTAAATIADLAGLLSTLGRHEEAAKRWQEVGKRHPKDVSPRINAALALANSGRIDEALTSAREAVALGPDMAAAHHMLGVILAESGRSQEAKASVRRAVELDPSLTEAHLVLARLLLIDQDASGALASASRAKALQPTSAEVLAVWASAHAAAGSLDQAIQDTVPLARTDENAAYAAAFLYRQRGDTGTVQALMRNLARSHPDWVWP